jgi:tripartite-type tricarboxylate transporter receptor subunit TctC
MKYPRRRFLHLAAGAAAAPAFPRFAFAEVYPARPVHIIVGLAAGGGVDIVARLAGQWLSERLNQPFIIENRLGAAGNLATEFVVNADPDGYTLLQVPTPAAINVSLYKNLNFNFLRDIAPIASLVQAPLIMVVGPSFPAKTVPEFIAYAKAHPGEISMASSGIGTPLHVAGELFKMMTGIDMVHVPYRGVAPAFPDLLAGQVQVLFADTTALPLIKDGKLRALAVTTAKRSDALPDVPAMSEFVPGYEASTWQGMGAPKNTPDAILDKLHTELEAAVADAGVRAHFGDLGFTPLSMSRAEFSKFIAADTEKWAKVVKFAGLQAQ